MGRHLEVDQGQALLRVPEDIVEVRVTVDEDCPVVGKEPYPLRQPGVGSVKKRVRQPVSTPQTRQDHIEHPVSRPGPQDLRRAERCAPGDRPPGLIATVLHDTRRGYANRGRTRGVLCLEPEQSTALPPHWDY